MHVPTTLLFSAAALVCVASELDETNAKKVCNLFCTICHRCIINDQGEPKCIYQDNCCPNNTRVFCYVSPCAQQSKNCPQVAHCIPDYCNGCNAHYYDKDYNEICITSSQVAQEANA